MQTCERGNPIHYVYSSFNTASYTGQMIAFFHAEPPLIDYTDYIWHDWLKKFLVAFNHYQGPGEIGHLAAFGAL